MSVLNIESMSYNPPAEQTSLTQSGWHWSREIKFNHDFGVYESKYLYSPIKTDYLVRQILVTVYPTRIRNDRIKVIHQLG